MTEQLQDNVIDFDAVRTAEQAAKDLVPILSEDQIALEFVNRNEPVIRFDWSKRAWYTWRDNRWRSDATGVVFSWNRSFARAMGSDGSPSDRRRLGSRKFAEGVDGLARTDQRIAVTADHWDCDLDLLGTPTGVVDLRTGELFDPAPEQFITRAVAADPDIAMACPRWFRFLNEVTGNDDTLKRFLQQYCGYGLTGETREQKLVFALGRGGTGKSVFANTLRKIMADYAASASMETFTDSMFSQHPEQLARLAGIRLVIANETESGHRWRETLIKHLTGGDIVVARYMRQNSFEFQPRFKLLIFGNHAPAITNLDTAIKRRFLIVPFDRPPPAPDDQLDDILREEWPAILRWMINGAVDWYANGLVVPKAVSEATTRYFDNQDVIGQWLEEACEVDPKNEHLVEKSADLFASWSVFAKSHGEMPGTQATFNENLRFRGFEPKQIKALGTKGCRGIRLKLPQHWQDR